MTIDRQFKDLADSEMSKCVGTMKTDFISFFQDEIHERLKKAPELDAVGFLYFICIMEEKKVPTFTIVEKIKEILACRVSDDEEGREEFMEIVSEISAKYTNQWIEEYFGPKNKKSDLLDRTSRDENPQTSQLSKGTTWDIIDHLR